MPMPAFACKCDIGKDSKCRPPRKIDACRALTASHRAMIGEKSLLMVSVPNDWAVNSATRMASVAPTIAPCEMLAAPGAIEMPLTAERTEMAGVRAPVEWKEQEEESP